MNPVTIDRVHLADLKQLALLTDKGIDAWNAWRGEKPRVRVDLTGANLAETHLTGIDLRRANLRGADIAHAWLADADLRGANLSKIEAREANFMEANLEKAKLRGATLAGAFMPKARLPGADLTGTNLNKANLEDADLSGATLARAQIRLATVFRANLSGADLEGADLSSARLNGVNFRGARLCGAFLNEADLSSADFTGADLRGAQLSKATLVETRLHGADLTGANIFGISAWDVGHDDTTVQRGLVITPAFTPEITVGDLEVAQFVYLLLENRKIRNVLDTVTSKAVLILGRFSEERKAALDAIHEALRSSYDMVPILVDFPPSPDRDLTETVQLLAGMCRFVIADLTDAKSIPQELSHVVPNFPSVPIQPILLAAQHEYGMFEHWSKFPNVLENFSYENTDHLLENLESDVIDPVKAWEETTDRSAARERRLRETMQSQETRIAELEAKLEAMQEPATEASGEHAAAEEDTPTVAPDEQGSTSDSGHVDAAEEHVAAEEQAESDKQAETEEHVASEEQTGPEEQAVPEDHGASEESAPGKPSDEEHAGIEDDVAGDSSEGHGTTEDGELEDAHR